MESDLYVYCRYTDKNQRALAREFLHEETRPILEEDVEPAQRPIFLALEEVDFPQSIDDVESASLLIHWFSGMPADDEELATLFSSLQKAGAQACAAAVLIDGMLDSTACQLNNTFTHEQFDFEEEGPVDGGKKALVSFLIGLLD